MILTIKSKNSLCTVCNRNVFTWFRNSNALQKNAITECIIFKLLHLTLLTYAFKIITYIILLKLQHQLHVTLHITSQTLPFLHSQKICSLRWLSKIFEITENIVAFYWNIYWVSHCTHSHNLRQLLLLWHSPVVFKYTVYAIIRWNY